MSSHEGPQALFAAAAFLVVGLASLWSKWNGNAGISAASPISEWSVSFNGSVHGWPAMIGTLAILTGVVLFLIALVKGLIK